MKLPIFKYYPNAAQRGVFQASDEICYCCDKVRGYIYSGPINAREELVICPWCLADGSAHRIFKATFLDSPKAVGGYGKWDQVSQEIVDEIVCRTPGVDSWQAVYWFTHCNDAAAYLGPVGYKELLAYGNNAILAIKETSGVSNDDWNEYLKLLAIGESPTAYLFQCLYCGEYGGFSDCD
jgi:uncharacterized protein